MSTDASRVADPGRPASRPSAWKRWTLLVGAAFCFASFIALGCWQVQRLAWKQALIARVDARVHAAPVPPPGAAQWAGITAANSEYLRVRATGRYLHDKETLVQATTALGAGFWVITPLQVPGGSFILVNRGFVPPQARRPADRSPGNAQGEVSIEGLLRITEPGGGFLRKNAPEAGRWHSRDVAAMAAAQGLPAAQVAPYFIDAQVAPGAPPDAWPRAGLTVIRFNNSHWAYILTWFGLAAMVLVGAIYVWRSDRRAAPERTTPDNRG